MATTTAATRRPPAAADFETECARNNFPNDAEFAGVVGAAHEAIDLGIYPEMIRQGSSGSYFVKNKFKQNIGVFKPKNEEPYGPQNPKWTKWFQKQLCPCCFGRGCLLLNQGYLSEAGAHIVDEKLRLNVVPKTKIVHMAAPTFNYNILDRTIAEAWPKQSQSIPGVRFKGLPAKILDIASATPERFDLPVRCEGPGIQIHSFVGFRQSKQYGGFASVYDAKNLLGTHLSHYIGSMQKFVNGYVSATEFDYDRLVTVAAKRAFRAEFERLVILDYIIRNTDRGSDNWLIKYEDVPNPRYVPSLDTTKSQESADDTALANSNNSKGKGNNQAVVANLSEKSSTAAAQGATSTSQSPTIPFVKIAAIDNGLAFPFKHPDEWRAWRASTESRSAAQASSVDRQVNITKIQPGQQDQTPINYSNVYRLCHRIDCPSLPIGPPRRCIDCPTKCFWCHNSQMHTDFRNYKIIVQ